LLRRKVTVPYENVSFLRRRESLLYRKVSLLWRKESLLCHKVSLQNPKVSFLYRSSTRRKCLQDKALLGYKAPQQS
jgi:hypothetical protein